MSLLDIIQDEMGSDRLPLIKDKIEIVIEKVQEPNNER